jgi:hypothetical protein
MRLPEEKTRAALDRAEILERRELEAREALAALLRSVERLDDRNAPEMIRRRIDDQDGRQLADDLATMSRAAGQLRRDFDLW